MKTQVTGPKFELQVRNNYQAPSKTYAIADHSLGDTKPAFLKLLYFIKLPYVSTIFLHGVCVDWDIQIQGNEIDYLDNHLHCKYCGKYVVKIRQHLKNSKVIIVITPSHLPVII